MKKICYIMVSPSGSGKSTLAKKLVSEKNIFSTDSYFAKDGVYKFEEKKIGYNHKLNFEAFCKALETEECVCCDNTNLRLKDINQYKKAAEEAGYSVSLKTGAHPKWEEYLRGDVDKEEIVDFLFESNVHAVPKDTIQMMVENFDKVWKA